jgi:fibro-slime domain-containing protein
MSSHTRLIFSSAACFGLMALTGALSLPRAASHAAPFVAPPADAPDHIVLTGIVRDFREKSVAGGHPDFENQPDNGFGLYSGNVAPKLDDEGRISWKGDGHKVSQQWRDKQGRQICHDLYDSALADEEGTWGAASTGGVTSAASFDQWFRDVPGVNVSAPLALTLVRSADGSYVFDDKLDPLYADKGGFFPIDDQLFGNSSGTPKHNFHFTFELRTRFTYKADGGQVFKFIGDDDVFVFIDGKLVIDLGGVHAAQDQFVDLNRLGLIDGETYTLDFFFAERHRTQSNFRIQTNLELIGDTSVPTINAGFD